MVKSPPAVQETGLLSLGQEDLLEEGVATQETQVQSLGQEDALEGRIPWTEEPGGL